MLRVGRRVTPLCAGAGDSVGATHSYLILSLPGPSYDQPVPTPASPDLLRGDVVPTTLYLRNAEAVLEGDRALCDSATEIEV
jgi:hypothetical protein